MSNVICKCGSGLGNTGLPSCSPTGKVIKKVVFVQMVSAAGVTFSIDPAGTVSKSGFLTPALNNADLSLRLFPTPEVKEIVMAKEDPVFKKYKDGSSFFVREGVRTFVGVIPDCPAMYKSKLESVRCNANTGVYLVDIENNWIGLTNETDGKLYPFPINTQAMVGKVVFPDDDDVQNMMVTFEFPPSVRDADIRMIGGSLFTDWQLGDVNGLLDVTAAVSAITTTGFTLTLTTPGPDLGNPIPVQGVLAANFLGYISNTASKLYNLSDTADMTVTVTEGNAGVYAVAFAAETSADVLDIKLSKTGFDMSGVNPTNNPIVIP